jgi:microcystin-dependent protein
MSEEIYSTPVRSSRYLAPDVMPTEYICRRLRLPDSPRILAAVSDVLAYLAQGGVWEETDVTDAEMQALMSEMFYQFNDVDCESGNMIGELKEFLTDTLPTGILLCDGAQYNQVDYPLLYDALPAAFKSGATFVVPNLAGRVLVGNGGSYTLGATGGAALHTLTSSEMPEHSHGIDHEHTTEPHAHEQDAHQHELTIRNNAAVFGNGLLAASANAVTNDSEFTSFSQPSIENTTVLVNGFAGNSANAGGDGAHNNMPPYLVVKIGIVAE